MEVKVTTTGSAVEVVGVGYKYVSDGYGRKELVTSAGSASDDIDVTAIRLMCEGLELAARRFDNMQALGIPGSIAISDQLTSVYVEQMSKFEI